MWRVVVVGVGALGAYLASKRAWAKLQESPGENTPITMIVKGATAFQNYVGPWSVHDLTLGLAAMAKVAEKEPPRPPGAPNKELSKNTDFLARAQHWRAMAEAAYVCDVSLFSLMTHLPESALIHGEWNPDQNSLRPAYCVCIDAPYNAVVLAIRGTSHIVDMLVDSAAAAEEFQGGKAHAGFVHAVEVLLKEAEPHLKRAFEQAKATEQERGCEAKLVLVGHSMGGSVAIMCGFRLRDSYPGMECWSFSTPASLTYGLAVESAEFATSFVSAYDVVPRFSIASVERLRKQLQEYDWENARRLLKDDPDWKNVEKVIDTFKEGQAKVAEAVDGVKQQFRGKESREGGRESSPQPPVPEEKTEREPPPEFYPPGRLLVLAADPPGCGKTPGMRANVHELRNYGAYPSFEESLKTKWSLHEAKHEEFSELVISPWSISDHMLGNMCEGIGYLQSRCGPLSHQRHDM